MKFNVPIIKLLFKHMAKGEKLKPKHKKQLDKYECIHNINYSTLDLKKNIFSIYYPKKDLDKNHLIIDVHGGAYSVGNINTNIPYLLTLLSRGYTIINIDYRNKKLNNDITIKNQCEDVVKAVEYIIENKEKYHLPKRMTLMGDSAGGHLALYALCKIKNKNIFSSLVLSSSVTDYETLYEGAKKLITKNGLKLIFKDESESEKREFNPIHLINKDFITPTFLISSSKDFILEQSQILNEKLKNNGTIAKFYYLITNKMKFGHVFNQIIGKGEKERKDANVALIKFIDKYN